MAGEQLGETAIFDWLSLDLVLGLVILCLLVVSGFFSGSETALTAASRARLHHMEREGDRKSRRALELLKHPDRLIGAILLGNNAVNILASSLATSLFLSWFGQAGVAYATLVMTLMVLVFAEVLPKTYAIAHPTTTARKIAGPVGAIVWALSPIVESVRAVVGLILRLLGVKGRERFPAHEELRGAISMHHAEGGVERDDADRLGGILDLKDLDVAEVMIHRRNLFMLPTDLAPEELLRRVLRAPYSRIPLFKGEQENIIGVLHIKDLLRASLGNDDKLEGLNVLDIARKPWFIPDTTPVVEQLDTFLASRNHFALVVDEYGALQGLITLEDIIEEIVGEIHDEHDIKVAGVHEHDDGSYVVDGTVSIRDLNRSLGWDLPDDDAITLAGLIIHEARTIPEKGQVFNFHGHRFEILERQRNQIRKVGVKKPRGAKSAEAMEES